MAETVIVPTSSTKFLEVLIFCGGLAGISSAAAGLKLAITPRVIAMKSKVVLYSGISQISSL